MAGHISARSIGGILDKLNGELIEALNRVSGDDFAHYPPSVRTIGKLKRGSGVDPLVVPGRANYRYAPEGPRLCRGDS